MKAMKKKAKLAHDKRRQDVHRPQGVGPYTFQRVIDIVEFNEASWALVDIDGNQTLGLVDPGFTRLDRSGTRVPSALACPAAYCVNSGARAKRLAVEYLASQGTTA